MAENAEAIATNSLAPKKVTVDGQTVEQHSVDDQIKADKYKATKAAAIDPRVAFCRVRIVPPGTV